MRNGLNKRDKQMIVPQRIAISDWLVECLNGQIEARSMSRTEAIAQIKASLERVKQAGIRSVAEAEQIAAGMIAALADDPA